MTSLLAVIHQLSAIWEFHIPPGESIVCSCWPIRVTVQWAAPNSLISTGFKKISCMNPILQSTHKENNPEGFIYVFFLVVISLISSIN
jgi:hypothetical protein